MDIKRFKVELMLNEPMLGTVPKNKEVYAAYIATKNPDGIDPDEIESIKEIEEKGWTGFHVDDDGPFIYNYMIKGFLKSAGNTLKDQLKIKALKSKIDKFVFVGPRKIRLPDIEPEPLERPLRAMTMQGPRVSLARSDYVAAGTILECEVKLLKSAEIKEKTLRFLFEYGELKGLGQWRNADYGQFSYEMKPIK